MLDSIEVPTSAAIAALKRLGYLTSETVTEDELKDAIAAFQAFHAIPRTGEMDVRTVHEMTTPHRCGLPDQMAATMAKWPMNRVTFMSRLNLNIAGAKDIYTRWVTKWNDVCAVELTPVFVASEANIVADDYSNPRDQFGQRGGVLADSAMPYNVTPQSQLPQRFDTAENWTEFMLGLTSLHEVGHAIGIEHLPAGNVMGATLNTQLSGLQPGDIAAAVARYGTPKKPTGSPRVEVVVYVGTEKFVAAGQTKPA